MPKSKVIYTGLILILASALLWVGAWLTKQIEFILPYTGILGILVCILGVVIEIKKSKEAKEQGGETAPPPG